MMQEMMRNRIVNACLRLALVLSSIALCGSQLIACSCAGAGPFGCKLPAAPVAFLGRVVSRQDVDLRPPYNPPPNYSGRRMAGDPLPPPDESYIAVTLQVVEPFRGDFGNTIVIATEPMNNSCYYPFEIGKDYLVFAETYKGRLYTSICQGTREAEREVSLIQQLRAARQGLKQADLFGQVLPPLSNTAKLTNTEPLPSLEVTAKSDVAEFHASTAPDGTYEFFGLPRGRYSVTLKQPPMREAMQDYKKDVGSGEACHADFQLDYQGEIRGVVVDSDGRGINGIISTYSPELDPSRSLSSVAEVANGQFVIKRIPPGHYKLRLLRKSDGRVQSGFIDLPGEVEIGDGTVVDPLEFKIP
jgi:hypothetical protein